MKIQKLETNYQVKKPELSHSGLKPCAGKKLPQQKTSFTLSTKNALPFYTVSFARRIEKQQNDNVEETNLKQQAAVLLDIVNKDLEKFYNVNIDKSYCENRCKKALKAYFPFPPSPHEVFDCVNNSFAQFYTLKGEKAQIEKRAFPLNEFLNSYINAFTPKDIEKFKKQAADLKADLQKDIAAAEAYDDNAETRNYENKFIKNIKERWAVKNLLKSKTIVYNAALDIIKSYYQKRGKIDYIKHANYKAVVDFLEKIEKSADTATQPTTVPKVSQKLPSSKKQPLTDVPVTVLTPKTEPKLQPSQPASNPMTQKPEQPKPDKQKATPQKAPQQAAKTQETKSKAKLQPEANTASQIKEGIEDTAAEIKKGTTQTTANPVTNAADYSLLEKYEAKLKAHKDFVKTLQGRKRTPEEQQQEKDLRKAWLEIKEQARKDNVSFVRKKQEADFSQDPVKNKQEKLDYLNKEVLGKMQVSEASALDGLEMFEQFAQRYVFPNGQKNYDLMAEDVMYRPKEELTDRLLNKFIDVWAKLSQKDDTKYKDNETLRAVLVKFCEGTKNAKEETILKGLALLKKLTNQKDDVQRVEYTLLKASDAQYKDSVKIQQAIDDLKQYVKDCPQYYNLP